MQSLSLTNIVLLLPDVKLSVSENNFVARVIKGLQEQKHCFVRLFEFIRVVVGVVQTDLEKVDLVFLQKCEFFLFEGCKQLPIPGELGGFWLSSFLRLRHLLMMLDRRLMLLHRDHGITHFI